ncbi:MarR family winged helix-turn-helix transcriptional regulator [Nocardioides sp. SR21]|uniref:MarR family winged helix-turn-helix transcriptional regulator n=1 Tax=Nocardioides sp. SR21 TaxID=2919501 RepID=UPI001FA944A4|nr:MarR family transcriptional regulator [Nocardioides sp. SR21]
MTTVRYDGDGIDITAMAVVSSVHRAAHALRTHLERTVLAPRGLTWTAWVVLWVVWTWGESECRHVAAEAGISKATLTGVQQTLVGKGLLARDVHPDDARRVLLSLTDDGKRFMERLFPEFNGAEAWLVAGMAEPERLEVARGLRTLVRRTELR